MAEASLLVAGVDVGGTNIEVGPVDDQHQVHARKKAPTPTEGISLVAVSAAIALTSQRQPVTVEAVVPPE